MDSKSLPSSALTYVILGLILIFFPNLTTGLFCTLVGLLLVAYGVITIVSFFVHQGAGAGLAFQAELISGVIAVVVGGIFLTRSHFIISVIPAVLGLYILVDGLMNLKRGLDMRRMGYAGWTAALIMAGVSLLLAVLILRNPFSAGLTLWRVIGGAFLYQGISDFWAIRTFNKLL